MFGGLLKKVLYAMVISAVLEQTHNSLVEIWHWKAGQLCQAKLLVILALKMKCIIDNFMKRYEID